MSFDAITISAYYETPEWKKLRRACMKHDKYRCQRCKVHFPYGRNLTAHHIVPLREDGKSSLRNLVSLCEKCHNFVEINNIRSLYRIKNSAFVEDQTVLITIEREQIIAEQVEDWNDIDWRIIVYGGIKDYETAKSIMQEMQSQKIVGTRVIPKADSQT